MECPVCKQEMKKVRWHITYDASEKEFDHTTYHCKADDVWLTTEIPKSNSSQQSS